MINTQQITPIEAVSGKILLIRGRKVLIDVDLADMYGVSTKRLNEQVKRNKDRFPDDFMLRLNREEKAEVVAKCDHLSKIRFSSQLPYAFTEHGVAMLSSVLKSERAVQMNIFIVRAFIRLREVLASNRNLAHKVEELERGQKLQNSHVNRIYKILGKFLEEPQKPRNPIGFQIPK